MASIHNLVHQLDNFNISNLISGEGVVLDVENDLMTEEEQEYQFKKTVPMTPEEILRSLNMDENVDENDDREPFMYCQGNSFNELKERMEDISGNGKVYKYVLRKGVGEVVPKNSRVSIKYVGYFEFQDEPFDSTAAHDNDCMTLRINNGEILPGLDIGISTMKKHETSVFIIHPDYAYGEMGCLPRVPGNAQVLFNVSLVDLLDDSKVLVYEDLSNEDKQQFSILEPYLDSLIKSANDYFKRKNIRQAIRDYKKAMYWLEKVKLADENEEKKMKKWLSRVYSNLGVCYIKEDRPRLAARALHMVYPEYRTAKTYFNTGRALGKLGQFEEAMDNLQKALELEPRNQMIREELSTLNDQKTKYREAEKKLWANCLKESKKAKEKTEFEKSADEWCDLILNDDKICRQALPDCLTKEEEKYFGMAAASRGLNIMTERRHGKDTLFITKKNF